MELLDTWQWQIDTSHTHAQGKCNFTGCTENLLHAQNLDARLMDGKSTGCMAVASARIIRVHALQACTAQTVGQ